MARSRDYEAGYTNGKFDGYTEAARAFNERIKATEMAIQTLGSGANAGQIITMAQRLTGFWEKGEDVAK